MKNVIYQYPVIDFEIEHFKRRKKEAVPCNNQRCGYKQKFK